MNIGELLRGGLCGLVLEQCGVMPSPRPSPTGRGGKATFSSPPHRERGKTVSSSLPSGRGGKAVFSSLPPSERGESSVQFPPLSEGGNPLWLLLCSQRLFYPAVELLLVGFNPAVNVTLNICF